MSSQPSSLIELMAMAKAIAHTFFGHDINSIVFRRVRDEIIFKSVLTPGELSAVASFAMMAETTYAQKLTPAEKSMCARFLERVLDDSSPVPTAETAAADSM